MMHQDGREKHVITALQLENNILWNQLSKKSEPQRIIIPKKHFKPKSEVISKGKVILQRQKQVLRRTNSFSHPKGRVSSGTQRKPKVFIQAHTLWHMRAQTGTCTTRCSLCWGTHLSPKSNRHTHKMPQTSQAHPTTGKLLCAKSSLTFLCPHYQGQNIRNQPHAQLTCTARLIKTPWQL